MLLQMEGFHSSSWPSSVFLCVHGHATLSSLAHLLMGAWVVSIPRPLQATLQRTQGWVCSSKLVFCFSSDECPAGKLLLCLALLIDAA